MKSIYEVLVDLAGQHKKFKTGGYCDLLNINFVKKRISNGNTVLMENGVMRYNQICLNNNKGYDLNGLPLLTDEEMGDDFYERVIELFSQYECSVPSRNSSYGHTNFVAKHIDELTVEEIASNEERSVARYKLELYILFMGLMGKVKWEDESKFYLTFENSNLILFRDWFIDGQPSKYKLDFNK